MPQEQLGMAQILSILSVIAFAVAGVCFVGAVILWFVLRIPAVIGDLSGRTARKSIERSRIENEKKRSKSRGAGAAAAGSSQKAKKQTQSGRKVDSRQSAQGSAELPQTDLLPDGASVRPATDGTALLGADETMMLDRQSGTQETMPLDSAAAPETAVLSAVGTAVLLNGDRGAASPGGSTEELKSEPAVRPTAAPVGVRLTVLEEEMSVSTDEVIP